MTGRLPRRRSLPLSVMVCSAAWVGVVVAEAAYWSAGTGAVAILVVGACGACGWVAAGRVRGRLHRVGLAVAVGLLLGTAGTAAHLTGWERSRDLLSCAGARRWEGLVVSDADEGRFGALTTIRVTGGTFDGCRIRLGLPSGACQPDIGRAVTFKAIVKVPSDLSEARAQARRGIVGFARPWAYDVSGWRSGTLGGLYRWRASARSALDRVSGDAGALLAGIALGDKTRLAGSDVEADFRASGLSHALAVSGLHVSIVSGAVLAIASTWVRRRRTLVVLSVVSGWVFAAVTGWPLSAVRACAMLSIAGCGQLVALRPDPLAALAAAATAVLAVNPMAAFDVGFQLSVCAVAGILVIGPWLSEWLIRAAPGAPRSSVLGLAATVAAQASTLPVCAAAFGSVSVIAPIANLVVLPVIETMLGTCLAGLVLGGWATPAGWCCLSIARCLARVACAAARAFGSLPVASVAVTPVVGLVFGLGALVTAWRCPPARSRGVALAAAALACCGVLVGAAWQAPVAGTRIVVLDVGQGDAILVQSGADVILVDTGPDAATLRKALGRFGIRRLEGVIITHAHDDHIGGLQGLRGLVHPRWVGYPAVEDQSAAIVPVIRRTWPSSVRLAPLAAGDRFQAGRAQVLVLSPVRGGAPVNANDASVVLEVADGGFEAVLTGDAERSVQESLAVRGALHPVEVLKVPHHGSVNGLDERGLRGWAPKAAVISVGKGNDFGHPSAEVLDALQAHGARTFRTDVHGDVVIHTRRGRWWIRTGRHRPRAGAQAGMRYRGLMRAAYVTIRCVPSCYREEYHGRLEDRRSAARLPDPWQGRVLARKRSPPPAEHVRSGRPGRDGHRRVRRQGGLWR